MYEIKHNGETEVIARRGNEGDTRSSREEDGMDVGDGRFRQDVGAG